MAQIHEPPPSRQTERIERSDLEEGGFAPPARRSSAGRTAALALMLVAIALVAAGVGFLLAGGRLPSSGPSPAPTAAVAKAPEVAPTSTQPAPTAPPAPTAVPKPTEAPAPTAPPPPTAAPTVAPTTPPQPTPSPPTAVPKPTEAPLAPAPAAEPANEALPPAPAAKPANPAAGQEGVSSPVRPGADARRAQIEGRITEYFEALGERDFAHAQQVCCTAEWRARNPLERWQRNFDGVTDLRLVDAPRYLRVQDDVVVVDTDYTFVSGGVRRNFTLRWTFQPVGSEWQADLAEAFPTQSAPIPRPQPTPTPRQDGGAVSAPVPQPSGPSARPVLSAHAIAHRMIAAGDSVTLTYEVTNPGSTPVTAILGASIRPISGGPWINDPANDKRLTFPPGKSSHTRVFRVPIGTPAGRYDVAWGLFGDGRQGWGPAVESGVLTINQ
jgi:outer membrane biosynthesis protein TonB